MSALLWTSPACHSVSLGVSNRSGSFSKGVKVPKMKEKPHVLYVGHSWHKDGQIPVSALEERPHPGC